MPPVSAACAPIEMPPGSNRLFVNPLKNLSRPGPIRIHNCDPILAKTGGYRRALACSQVFEIQIAHHSRRMDDRDRNSSLFGRGIDSSQALAAGAKEFHSTNRSQSGSEAVHAIADISR